MADRIALATHAGLPHLSGDDRLLLHALRGRGHDAEPAIWSAPNVDWSRYQAVVVRSCWDYHLRLEEFRSWVDALERADVALWNSPAVLRWNANKGYLRELEAAGVTVVPTRWIDRADPRTLLEHLAEAGWAEAVVKPTVSATAYETWRTSAADAGSDEARFRALVTRGEVMLQPFLAEVVEAGEWSLVFLGGAFSHSVLKRPRAGDFRVQQDHGGTAVAAMSDPGIVAQARMILHAVPGDWIYARVDGCVVDGCLCLMELEMLEPALFLGTDGQASERLADAVERAMIRAGGAVT